jgi:hypothetical protein
MSSELTGSVDYDYYTYLDPNNDSDSDYSISEPYDIGLPEHQEWYQPNIFDINIPIHPEYKKWLNPVISVGDLVETDKGDVGIVISVKKPEGIALRIKQANNNTYTVMISGEERLYIGYSLKKITK